MNTNYIFLLKISKLTLPSEFFVLEDIKTHYWITSRRKFFQNSKLFILLVIHLKMRISEHDDGNERCVRTSCLYAYPPDWNAWGVEYNCSSCGNKISLAFTFLLLKFSDGVGLLGRVILCYHLAWSAFWIQMAVIIVFMKAFFKSMECAFIFLPF